MSCKNNIYVQDLTSRSITQLTHDGNRDLINGTFDWVNEEEFYLRDGFRWSPDGSHIAYWQVDTSGVANVHHDRQRQRVVSNPHRVSISKSW